MGVCGTIADSPTTRIGPEGQLESVQSASIYVGVVGAEMVLVSTGCMLKISLKCWRVPYDSCRVVGVCWRG